MWWMIRGMRMMSRCPRLSPPAPHEGGAGELRRGVEGSIELSASR